MGRLDFHAGSGLNGVMPTLSPDMTRSLLAQLEDAHEPLRQGAARDTERQPVHTVYGGADRFRADTAAKFGRIALAALDRFAPTEAAFAALLEVPTPIAAAVRSKVAEKLTREPVEDLRIDFEDGYGYRPDEEEDAHAQQAARTLAEAMQAASLPPFIGFRVKSLSAATRARALRTLDLFLSALAEAGGGQLPQPFCLTLPKVEQPEQLSVLVSAVDALEERLGLTPGAIRVEAMVETPGAILGPQGELRLRELLEAARGRLVAAHLGPYDYSSAMGVAAAHQSLDHPVCRAARELMQLSFAGTGVRLSDGPVSIMPIPPHRGEGLSPAQEAENQDVMRLAWQTHRRAVQSALQAGYYQGWDLHPAQLVPRYAAVYAFYLQNMEQASRRLRNFVDKAGQATRVGHLFDDAATGQGLLNFFLQAIAAGALSEAEAEQATGLSQAALRSRSFAAIVQNAQG